MKRRARRALCLYLSGWMVLTAGPSAGAGERDEVLNAFGHLQKFARDAEQPASAAGVPPAVGAATDDHEDGPLDQRGTIKITQDYSNLLRDDERAFADEIVEIFRAFDARSQSIQVDVIDQLFPLVTARLVTWERRPRVRLSITTGALAMIQNRDELTAVIAQALSREAPEVLVHRDDPRVLRRIEEQVTFQSLPADARRMVHADLSAIERTKSAGRRPWALTDYEQRTFGFYRRDWSRRGGFAMARWRQSLDDKTNAFYEDGMLEVRLLAQKITVAYLQERENIRELVRGVHEFGPELKRIHQRARRHHSESLRPFALALKYGLAPFLACAALYALLFQTSVPARVADAFLALWNFGPVAGLRGLVGLVIDLQWCLLSAEFSVVQDVVEAAAGWVGAAATLVFGYVLDALAFLANITLTILKTLFAGLGDVFGPVWSAFVHYVVPVLKALGQFLAAACEGLFAFITNGYLLLAIPLAVAVLGAYLARGEIAAFARARGRNLYALGMLGLGFWNRWTRTSFVRDVLTAPTAPPGRVFLDIAEDLANIHDVVGGRPHYEAIYNRPRGLRVLGRGYMVPEDLWTMYKDFLDIVADRVEAGSIGAERLTEIMRTLHPRPVPEAEAYDFDRLERGVVPFTLVLSALERDDVRPRLARLHDVTARAFPASGRAADPRDGGTYTWAALNDTTVGPDAVMGVARVASILTEALAAGRPRDLARLQHLTFDRLRLFRVSNDLSRGAYPNLVAAADRRALDADAIRAAFLQIQDTKRLRYVKGDDESPRGDGWQTLEFALRRDEARALARGNVPLAVTLATWERHSDVHHDNHPFFGRVGMTFGFVAAWPFMNLARHATERALRRELGRRPSVAALAAYVEDELLARGAFVDRLTPALFHFLITHPEKIRDEDDVRALLDHDFFWPEGPIRARNVFVDGLGAWRGKWFRHAALDEGLVEALDAQKSKRPRSWKYQTNLSEKLHKVIVERMRALGLMPVEYAPLKALWIQLTDRGTTAETDRLMHDLIAKASPDEVDRLRDLATAEARVWETDLHSRMAIARARAQPGYRALLAAPAGPARADLIDGIVGDLKAALPERGLAFAHFLEDLSVRINSTYDEAKTLNAAKGDVSSSHAGDDNLRAVRDLFRKIAAWPRRDQFNFVKFLRGEEPAGERLTAAFPVVGLERIRRMYEILPLAVRVGLFDTLFTHGLIGDGPKAARWTGVLSRHIVGGQRTDAQRVTLQVLTAFLFAVREVGNAQMTTTILSYLYALPSTAAASPVEVLKLVLEIFGATGIKVGQFTYASQILGEQGAVLRSLQSRARVPARIEMYEDVYDLLGVPIGTPLPFHVLELLGAASMKYAFMAQDRTNLAKLVIKVFRLDAMNNVDLQFDVLEHMTEYLIAHHGPRYGVFRIIIKSARLAVKREGSMRNEIRRSRVARHGVYRDRSDEAVRVEVPREDLVNPRMIIAQYAPGVAFDDLPAAAKPGFARKLLEMEDDIYFADRAVIRFDPDRHAGNAQMRPNEIAPDELGPIDFGQLLRMPRAQRERITKLFALAQIAGRVTVNQWVLGEIADLLNLDERQREALGRHLGPHLRAAGTRPVTLYVATLAALEASGFAIVDTTYIDFVRGIIQLTPFEPFAPDARAPSRSFEAAVLRELKTYARAHRFDPGERAYIAVANAWRRLRGHALLPRDLAAVDFDQLIHREAAVHCDEALSLAN